MAKAKNTIPSKTKQSNIVGMKFGKLTVDKEVDPKITEQHKYRMFQCTCDCGNTKIVSISNLKSGGTKSCGCLHKESVLRYKGLLSPNRHKYKIEDFIGKRIGLLTILGEGVPILSGTMRRTFRCLCDCGNVKDLRQDSIFSGTTSSCGCYGRSKLELRTTHGYTHKKVYSVYQHMRSRCYDKKGKYYKDYGGRGIKVCDEWLNNPGEFCKWAMNNGWGEGLYIDRINVDGDYCPENCRFVDSFLNIQNQRLLRSTNTSGYRGVWKEKKTGKWRAEFQYKKTKMTKGPFKTKEQAARAYDKMVLSTDAKCPINFQ